MQVWLGIDAGGTKSKILALDRSKNIISSLEGPAIQLSSQRLNEAIDRLGGLIDQFANSLSGCEISGIGLGVSGGGREYIREKLTLFLNSRYPGMPVELASDGEAIHLEAFNDQEGILIKAATGTIVIGRCKDQWERAGGFGYLIGDWGSGFMLGQDFLKYAAGVMEISPESSWGTLLKEHFGLSTIENLLEAVYVNELSPAVFTPLLLEKAGEGNKACNRILQEHLNQLARQVFWVQQKLSGEINKISFTGYLAKQSFYQKELKNHILNIIPEAQWVKDTEEPALGACRLIMKGIGVNEK